MRGQLSAVAVLFLSLAVILHGYQIREKGYPKSRDYLQYTSTATGQTTAKPLLQLTNQTHHVTLGAKSRDGHIEMAAEDSTSENTAHTTTKTTIPVTTKILLPSSPLNYTFVTPNNSHVTALSTEGTIGPSSVAHLLVNASGASLSTANHITGRTPQLGGQTTLPKTFLTASHKSTTNQKPTPPIYVPGTSVPTQKVSFATLPAVIVLGPTLATKSSPAKTGTYEVLNGSRLCIKAEMGLELIVQENDLDFATQRHFNIDPSLTHASGKCGSQRSNLFLDFQGGSVNITFIKEENSYYISEVGAYLTISYTERTYQGMKHSMMMFETVVGHSFKCVSEQSIQLSAQLQMKTMSIHFQAFDFEGDCFGNVDECLSDYTVVLPVVGAIVVILCVVGLAVYKIHQRHQSLGYQRI
ncbi:lysosome-associated membrane glycoprotein 3 [Phodopus roborovskii]|uniref:Lysosome-associated membrane glycoprotein 3 n=1 Tax=Phodopus roborovskii TaxID=109678 RepID=A0AAU9ZJ62_PHORO|nr:lysosome-associated membrane glycoprotein 3 [Phodopus roborovskii]CAH6792145.1 Lamp3 [Phodopus roborovskii]